MMILNVGERLLALQILPREGNFLTLAVKRELISKLGITPEDIANNDIVEKDGQISLGKNIENEFKLSDVECTLIKNQLKELNDHEKLVSEMMTLYEKFV